MKISLCYFNGNGFMIQYNNQHQLHQYLIHSSGVILYCKEVMELPFHYEFTYKVVYISLKGLKLLARLSFHSNNLDLENNALLHKSFVLKVKVPKYHDSGLINKKIGFRIFLLKCIKVTSDRLDVLFRSKEECSIPFYFAQTF